MVELLQKYIFKDTFKTNLTKITRTVTKRVSLIMTFKLTKELILTKIEFLNSKLVFVLPCKLDCKIRFY